MGFDSSDDEEERTDLAQRIKELQRKSEEGKQQWWAFCDSEGHSNRRDPNKHNVEFLRRFFANRSEGVIPAGRASLAPQNEPQPEMHNFWVQRIKQTQRSSPDMKSSWEKYCDDHGAGVRDPQRHTSIFMQQFLTDVGACTGQEAMWQQMQGGAYPYAGWTPEAAWADYYARCGYSMQGGVPTAMQPGDGQDQPNGETGAPGMMPGMMPGQQMPGMMPGMWGAPFGAPPETSKPDEKEKKGSKRARSRSRSDDSGKSKRRKHRKRRDKKEKSKKRKGKRRRKSRSRSSSSSSSSS